MYIIGKRYKSFPYQEDLNLKDLSDLDNDTISNYCNNPTIKFENNSSIICLSSNTPKRSKRSEIIWKWNEEKNTFENILQNETERCKNELE